MKGTANKNSGTLGLIVLFNLLGFVLLALRSLPINFQALRLGLFISVIYIAVYILMKAFFKNCNFNIMFMIFTLTSISFITLYRLNADTAIKQVQWFLIGILVFFITIIFIQYIAEKLNNYFYILAALSIIILFSPLVVGVTRNGARNWIEFGSYTFQPSELVKILFIFTSASLLKDKKSIKELFPLMAFALICMGILMMENDFGMMIIYFAIFIIMLYIGTSNIAYILGGLAAAASGGCLAYLYVSHIKVRIEAWLNPWADATGKGYQIVQSLIAIGSGGWFGSGVGLGSPYVIPAAKTDFIFAAIAEEFGVLMALAVIIMYLLIVYESMKIALEANSAFYSLLSAGSASAIGLQAFIIIGGVIKLIPLTGVTLPFVSYGGSSMLANFMIVGIVQGVASQIVYQESVAKERYGESY